MHKPNNDIDGCRRCRDCGEWKPLEDFQTSTKRPSGRGSYCKPCFNQRTKDSYAKRVRLDQGRDVRKRPDVPDGHRYCPGCQQTKPLDDFPFNKAARSGRASYCKPCHTERGRQSKIKNHGGPRHYHLKDRYKISEHDVWSMTRAQGGVCAICEEPDPQHVDHNHTSGEVRGILCFNCNAGLGHFKDNIANMRRAIAYLEETSWQRVMEAPGVYRVRSPRRARLRLPSS